MSRVQVIIDGVTRFDHEVDACKLVSHHPKNHRDDTPVHFEMYCSIGADEHRVLGPYGSAA